MERSARRSICPGRTLGSKFAHPQTTSSTIPVSTYRMRRLTVGPKARSTASPFWDARCNSTDASSFNLVCNTEKDGVSRRPFRIPAQRSRYDVIDMSAKAALFTLLFLSTASLSSLCQTTPSKQDQINQHTQLAQQYLSQQRPDLAIPELQALVALEPENTEVQGNLGVLLFFRGDYAGAIPHLRAAVKAKPELWKIQGLLGLAERRTGDGEASRQ